MDEIIQTDLSKIKEDIDKLRDNILDNFEVFYINYLTAIMAICESKKLRIDWTFSYIGYNFREILARREHRCIINLAPNSLKTVQGIALVTLYVAFYPDTKFTITSTTENVRLKYCNWIRTILGSEYYKNLFPYIEIDNETPNQIDNFSIAKYKGSFKIFSMDSNIIGTDSEFLLVDDPHDSGRYRKEKQKYIINGCDKIRDLKGRLREEDGKVKIKYPWIVIMQRICKGDATDLLLNTFKFENWKHIRVPVVENRNDNIKKDGTRGHIYKFYDKYIFVEKGQITNTNKYTKDTIENLKSTFEGSLVDFNYLYMQENEDDMTAIFSLGLIKRHKSNIEELDVKKVVISADTSFGESDNSCISVWAITKDNRVFMVDLYIGLWVYNRLQEKAFDIFDQYDGMGYNVLVLIENAASGISLIQDFEKKIYGSAITEKSPKELREFKNMKIVQFKPQKEGDKQQRACVANTVIDRGIVYLPYEIKRMSETVGNPINVLDQLEYELKIFPQEGVGVHDDCVDSFTMFLSFFKKEFLNKKSFIETRNLITIL